jgi:hypothetical protein
MQLATAVSGCAGFYQCDGGGPVAIEGDVVVATAQAPSTITIASAMVI